MPGRPDGVIAVREMAGKVKNTLPDVFSTIIRKENGFQGGKLTRHPSATAKSLLVMYMLDHLGDEAGVNRGCKGIFREQLIRRRTDCAIKRGRTETKNVVVRLMLLANVLTAKLAGTQEFASASVRACLERLCPTEQCRLNRCRS